MPPLAPCPRCGRHVRTNETDCPFCKKPFRARLAGGAAAVGLALLTGCPNGGTPNASPTPISTPTPSPSVVPAPPYGAPPPLKSQVPPDDGPKLNPPREGAPVPAYGLVPPPQPLPEQTPEKKDGSAPR